MTTKNETNQSTNLINVLEEKSIDLSRPTEIRDYLETLEVSEIEAFFPLVASKLFASGIHRELDKHGAKSSKVGTPEYANFVKSWFSVWERGYLTPREEEKALKPTVVKGSTRAQALPFPIADICDRMRLLAPSGKSANAVHTRETIDKLADFGVDAFTAYYGKSMENPTSLLVKAVKELSEERAEKIRLEQEKLLGGVDLI